MADEALSTAERELLARRAPAATDPCAAPSRGISDSRSRSAGSTISPLDETIKPHDFQQPKVLDESQLGAFSSLHDRVARGFAPALSTVVRCPARVRLSSIEQSTYGNWLRDLEKPTCLSVVRADPLPGEWGLDASLAILFPILDRMMGGGREPANAARRPLTAIESRLAVRVLQLFLSEVAKAWHDVAALTLSVLRVESDPSAARIALPGEGIVRATFEISFALSRGTMSLCLPAATIRGLWGNLTAPSRGEGSLAESDRIAAQVKQTPVELIARLTATRMPTSELLELRVGDVIVTNHDVQRPLEVAVEGVARFTAQAGTHKGRKAVQIDAELDPPCDAPRA